MALNNLKILAVALVVNPLQKAILVIAHSDISNDGAFFYPVVSAQVIRQKFSQDHNQQQVIHDATIKYIHHLLRQDVLNQNQLNVIGHQSTIKIMMNHIPM